MQSKIFYIYDGSGKKLFGLSSCFATPSQNLKDNEVGLSPKFAAVLGIQDNNTIQLDEIQSAVSAMSQVIFTASDSDYSILVSSVPLCTTIFTKEYLLQIMNAAKVEYILLDQVRIVGLGQKVVVWMSPRLSITLTAGTIFCKLSFTNLLMIIYCNFRKAHSCCRDRTIVKQD